MATRPSSLVTLATCNLNQWALDFDGNVTRILESCRQAKEKGASYRLGPELEICGYGCEDHFLENDTFDHCWESLAKLLEEGATDNLLCDFGMPVLHGGVRYNCRVICHNRKVLLIRPKTAMADNGNYREGRYFTAYSTPANSSANTPEKHLLPTTFGDQFGQRDVPFGLYHLQCADGTTIGCESCEELWTPHASHIDLALRGVEIIGNGSGSHHELRKLSTRMELMISATRKCGGVYLYSNQRGCDGGRTYYDGCAMIVINGRIVAQAPQFDVHDVNVIAATIDLDDVRSYRASNPAFGIQAARMATEEGGGGSSGLMCDNVHLTFDPMVVSSLNKNRPKLSDESMALKIAAPEEECCLGPACWLWDFLRRSGAAGFFLPLSGGADSSSVAAIVSVMCILVTKAAREDPEGDVAKECRRVCRKDEGNSLWVPSDPQEMASFVLHTTFMGTDNSSNVTNSRAKRLGDAIGSYHLSIKIDLMVNAVLQVFQLATGHMPRFQSRGGTISEDLALQNIQARLRMVIAYLMAQLLPWVRGRSGFLLVLGSANVDEGLRGYMTKYDCSSADLNPIGAISKGDLKRMLIFLSKEYPGFDVLAEIANAPPTAELRPIDAATATAEAGHSQTDEEDMGMSYEELGYFGRLRKISRCGPVSMFKKLTVTWSHLAPSEVAAKVKRFFYYYSLNRHKMTTITPAYHAEAYSPDDNRFDLRQFLYNTRWTRQFAVIDDIVAQHPDNDKDKND
mmetsp:Transcript_8950/g.15548  ORF Transcript_8950/g.15548 Transcript_8950/m.15548 type:complete len:740 (-) Transcript_8950:63-2282(-)|eukprot:CAMPEP_0183724398 /NCGR_PEP_ID=MMETSP0737-20130205/17897_1 /TAXON_ID=385413 /ORGANISM="Thalassiosira miniscula, Strain CCMP1093" /LENGTH=739 /DNA_ID=CAMNT_0025954973 /DNA_START=81 /DNA_END=2300 /DNA_ORIENTATION=-